MERKMVCDICGAASFFIHSGTRDNPSIDVYECSKCHTKQLNSIVENDYANGFMNGKHMSPQEISDRLNECKMDDERRATMVAPWIQNKNVLDFGCGFGGFINVVSKITKSISGVELGNDELDYMISRGYDVKNSIEKFDSQFDVITLFHVFEHLKNPREWLNIIGSKIKKDGLLFIEVPNANDALLSLYENSSFADFTYWSAHLYLYTKESLTNLINETGLFTIEEEGQFQRYPLSNHLYWLSKGKSGGQNIWSFLNTDSINNEYKALLEKENMCDTLFYRIRRK